MLRDPEVNEPTAGGVLDLYKQLSAAGVPGMLFAFIVLLYRRKLCWGYQLEESRSESLEWKTAYLRSVGQADRALTVAKTAVEVPR